MKKALYLRIFRKYKAFKKSGAYGIRTRDLLHAMETRSQLR